MLPAVGQQEWDRTVNSALFRLLTCPIVRNSSSRHFKTSQAQIACSIKDSSVFTVTWRACIMHDSFTAETAKPVYTVCCYLDKWAIVLNRLAVFVHQQAVLPCLLFGESQKEAALP